MAFVALITLAVLALLILVVLYYLGVFYKVKVEVKRPPFADCTFLYKFYHGRYSSAGVAFKEVSKLTQKFHCVGIYFDDPKTVPVDETCYAIGILIEKEKTEKEEAEEIKETMQGVGYHAIELPAIERAMCAKFPFRIGLSIVVAVAKVYPALTAYIQENKIAPHPYLEYYKGNKIYFVAPLEKCSEFYVPEYEMRNECETHDKEE